MTAWQPVSACGPSCRTGGEAAAGAARTSLRLAGGFGVLLAGLLTVPLLRGAAAGTVARALLAVLGVRVSRRGPAPRPGSLLVANHVSWLDILALVALGAPQLVAKREVGGWPGIGWLAAATGTIFVDRGRPRSLPATVAQVGAALRAGRSVAVFPEGTTFCGVNRGRFRPAMFQAAIDAGAPVVPIAITYDSTAAAFIGDDTLWSSARRVAGLRSLTVTLIFAPALRPAPGADRRVLARAAQASVGVTPASLGLAA
jgi:1-acyl-sn-glycerol-3-phosphate acyltransferase